MAKYRSVIDSYVTCGWENESRLVDRLVGWIIVHLRKTLKFLATCSFSRLPIFHWALRYRIRVLHIRRGISKVVIMYAISADLRILPWRHYIAELLHKVSILLEAALSAPIDRIKCDSRILKSDSKVSVPHFTCLQLVKKNLRIFYEMFMEV